MGQKGERVREKKKKKKKEKKGAADKCSMAREKEVVNEEKSHSVSKQWGMFHD